MLHACSHQAASLFVLPFPPALLTTKCKSTNAPLHILLTLRQRCGDWACSAQQCLSIGLVLLSRLVASSRSAVTFVDPLLSFARLN